MNALRDAAVTECLAFATAFYDKMPYEIRDRVYLYLNEETSAMSYFDDNKIAAATAANSANSLNHWLLGEHVGPHFAYECVQSFYETTTFTIGGYSKHDLAKFLSKDCFGFDLVPSKLVRYFHFDFVCDDNDEFDFESYKKKLLKVFKKRAHDLSALTRPGTKISFTINFIPSHGEVQRLIGLVFFLKVLGPRLYKFREAQIGFQVELSVESPHSLYHGTHDITEFWDNPIEKVMKKVHAWEDAIGK
jgi:hypothetical protein